MGDAHLWPSPRNLGPVTIPVRSCRPRRGRVFVGTAVAVISCTVLVGCSDLQPVEFTRAPTTTIDEGLVSGVDDPGAATTTTQPLRRSRYVVEPGDTFSSIARKFGLNVDALMHANNILDPALLEAGVEIILPAPDVTVPPPWLQNPDESWANRSR